MSDLMSLRWWRPEPFAFIQRRGGGCFFNIKYQDLFDCDTCGAVVTDPWKHRAWHESTALSVRGTAVHR